MPGAGSSSGQEDQGPLPTEMPLMAEMAGATDAAVSSQAKPPEQESRHEWVYREGKWIRVLKTQAEEPQEAPAEPAVEAEPVEPTTEAATSEPEPEPAPRTEPAREEP